VRRETHAKIVVNQQGRDSLGDVLSTYERIISKHFRETISDNAEWIHQAQWQ